MPQRRTVNDWNVNPQAIHVQSHRNIFALLVCIIFLLFSWCHSYESHIDKTGNVWPFVLQIYGSNLCYPLHHHSFIHSFFSNCFAMFGVTLDPRNNWFEMRIYPDETVVHCRAQCPHTFTPKVNRQSTYQYVFGRWRKPKNSGKISMNTERTCKTADSNLNQGLWSCKVAP